MCFHDLTSDGIVIRPRLFRRLDEARKMTVVVAPSASGKTQLLRSWIELRGLADSTGWVSVTDDERDPRRFWIAVVAALGGTGPGSEFIQNLSPAPRLDADTIVDRLLTSLTSLKDRVWLVIDDLHRMSCAEALSQLGQLITRAPAELRFVLTTRHNPRLDLHRLRIAGDLTEIRDVDLRFTSEESRELLDAAGVRLPGAALSVLAEQTEGWAGGLRLAALSLARHPDPERFVAEFAASQRTVVDHLMSEVLARQPERMRRFLLRTSVLDRVSGELADLLTGDTGGERILRELQETNAFCSPLDPARSEFRYHELFASSLRMELRNRDGGDVVALHAAAAGWFAGHGYPVEAVRHAQAASDWGLATRVLADHWYSLVFNGQVDTARRLLAGFPADTVTASPELTALAVADEQERNVTADGEHHLALATARSGSVSGDRRRRLAVMLATLKLSRAHRWGDLPSALAQARPVILRDTAEDGLHEGLGALALITLGATELCVDQVAPATDHLQRGTEIAYKAGWPYLEAIGLAHLTRRGLPGTTAIVSERALNVVELAARHGWPDAPFLAQPYNTLAGGARRQGRFGEAVGWLGLSEHVLRGDSLPMARLEFHAERGLLELTRGQDREALASFRAAERLAELLVPGHEAVTRIKARILQTLTFAGATELVATMLTEMDQRQRNTAEIRIATAILRIVLGEPRTAADEIGPVLDSSGVRLSTAFVVEAVARDTLGDHDTAHQALERALDLDEPTGSVLWFRLRGAPGLLKRHVLSDTRHSARIADVLSLLGDRPAV